MNRERLHSVIDLVLDLGERLVPQTPGEAMGHFRQARREALLGIRALVDHALTRLESEEQKAGQAEESRAIPVE